MNDMSDLGYGFLRLPLLDANDDKSIDMEKACALVDRFIQGGGLYFDTAKPYHGGMSEASLRQCLVERYARDRFQIADKLTIWMVESPDDFAPFFEGQLAACGVDFFDYYFLHGLNQGYYEKCCRLDAFSFLRRMQQQGKIGHIAISFHDSAAVLERILTEHPEIEFVQLQLNYLDWESPVIQSRACYEVAVKHGKSVIVMEPVKGGTLAKVPPEVETLFQSLHPQRTPAQWAVKFAASLPGVRMVLSGMNDPAQIDENQCAVHGEPLAAPELEILAQARTILAAKILVPCTGCRYCMEGCPQKICIPQYFAMLNESEQYAKNLVWQMQPAYQRLAETHGKASACIGCKSCERHCPQQIPITAWLKTVAQRFEG